MSTDNMAGPSDHKSMPDHVYPTSTNNMSSPYDHYRMPHYAYSMSTDNMSTHHDHKSMPDDVPYDDFMKSLLPMISGPQVTIRVGEHDPAYQVSKDILCANSPYFSAMFAAGHFKEGAENAAVLEEIEGVVTPGSFQALVQWLYRGRVAFPPSLSPEEEITQILEFVRLADMTGVAGIDDAMSERLSTPVARLPVARGFTMASNPPHSDNLPMNPQSQPLSSTAYSVIRCPRPAPPSGTSDISALRSAVDMQRRYRMKQAHYSALQTQASSHRSPGQNIAHIIPLHIAYASELPPHNPVRRIFAAAAVEGFMRTPYFAFQTLVKNTPSFAMDLLQEVQKALHRSAPEAGHFVDPITLEAFKIGR
ncbi:hypothetical protein LOCC1_G006237 [Lachnellula occidentalis]|uniref:BTB domain-containing protein n=1 Tax=Lachnellula occidentalis TaxID=215460 RepID=A0A8H8RNV9_9HELO|nr:hypothetical protein LOCC1_G006237 [Lachnellula occidentalis]